MPGLFFDLRHALRRMGYRPALPLLCIAALALAVSASSVIFSAVYAVLLHPLPFAESNRLVTLWSSDLQHGNKEVEISYADFREWQRRNTVFTNAALISSVNLDFTITGRGEPMQVEGTIVTADFFPTLGAKPLAGRVFTPSDDVPNAPTVVVLSERLWRTRFGGDRDIIGKSLRINDQAAVVIGIMPAAFDYPRGVDLWAPVLTGGPEDAGFNTIRIFQGVARLRPGVSLAQSRAAMASLARQVHAELRPANERGLGVLIDPLEERLVGSARTALPLLLLAVGAVVLIACANGAHLRMVDAVARARELAVRTAIGAGSGRIIRQLLTESLVLCALGGAAGIALTYGGVWWLREFAPRDIPRIETAEVNAWVLAFAAVLVCASTILVGLAPAREAGRADMHSLLKDAGARGTGSRFQSRFRDLLLAGEVAMATALLAGAMLLLTSFNRLGRLDPGFRSPTQVLTFRVTLPQGRYASQEKRKAFYSALLDKLRALPGVESAGAILLRPLSGTVGWDYPFAIEGQSAGEVARNPASNFEAISPGYFAAMQIPLIAGRDFTDADGAGSTPVAIINESAAHRLFPGTQAVGKRMKIGRTGAKDPWIEVVGVAKDVRYREWDATRLDLYVPVMQNAQHRSDFVVRARHADLLRLTPAILRAVAEIDKDQPISSVATLDGLVSDALARPRFNAGLLAAFAICAAALVVVGLFGVLSHLVSQRTQEIGIRMALGAQRTEVLRSVLLRGLALAALGAAAGSLLALAAARAASTLLYGVAWWHPSAYAGAMAGVLLLSAAACLGPAIRASLVDPANALRKG
jgi:putative ABC transport system permease protein